MQAHPLRAIASLLLLALTLGCAARVPPPASARVVRGVPFYPQAPAQCGPASLASLLTFFGRATTAEQIAGEVYDADAGGTTTVAMLAYGARHALPIEVRHGTLADVYRQIDAGRPVIALLRRAFPPWRDYHFVVVTGYEPARKELYGYSGRNRDAHWTAEQFARRWAPAENWMLVWAGGNECIAPEAPDRRARE